MRSILTNLSEDDFLAHCQGLEKASEVLNAQRCCGEGHLDFLQLLYVLPSLQRGQQLISNAMTRKLARDEPAGDFVWENQLRYAKEIFKAVAN